MRGVKVKVFSKQKFLTDPGASMEEKCDDGEVNR